MYTSSQTSTEEEQLHDPNIRETERTTAESLREERKPRYKNIMHLWEFLLELLTDQSCSSLITWSRKKYGEFKLKNQEEVAKRWGMFKQRPNMNYEKLSRALRHYYNQGIIKKVPGQRLVYKFHKLPYEYTPGKTHYQNSLPTSQARTTREDEYCFNGSSLCGNRRADDSERPLTNKEITRRSIRERLDVATNLDKPTEDPKQKAQEREVSPPPDSLELPSVKSLPCSHSVMSNPVYPAVCCYYSLRDMKRLCCPTQIMYPVSAYENFRSVNSVPVSVITKRYYQ